VIHDRHGYWLHEAPPVPALPALSGDVDADVVVIGGGYTGLWTAWNLLQAEPDLAVVVLEAERCGHGPSGRNGGFVNSLWYSLPRLIDAFGRDPAVAVARASQASVDAIGAFCAHEGVDAWFARVPHLLVSAAPSQDGFWDRAVAACAAVGAAAQYHALTAAQVRERIDVPVLRAGAALHAAATVQPARLALGLRERVRARGADVFESSPVRALRATGATGVVAETPGGRVRARHGVLAAGAAAAGVGPLRRRLTVASSHMVLTEPVPDVLEATGWTGGEAITDARSLLHYFRTTPDGRIAFGWAGGRMGYGGRLGGRIEVDPGVARQTRADLVRVFPALAGRRITHAWGGPIDVSPAHLPAVAALPGGRVHYAVGFTGNGVGPSHLAGRILASLARDRRDELSRLALVEARVPRVPPEPVRWLGGALIRRALIRRERREESGGAPDPVTRLVTDLPRRIGVHIVR